ncbi:MAG: PQQ-dependent sugar dehydrogenase [Bacteroidota bacterium]
MSRPLIIQFFLALLVFSSCAQPSPVGPENGSVTYEKVTDGIQNPWGMTWLPNGDMLVTEKKGEIRIIRQGRLLDESIQGIPDIYVRGQGGLMDIELHPDFENNRWLYLSYASRIGGGSGGNTTIARFKLQGNRLTSKEVLYKAEPNTTKGQHFGSRLAFDREGYLYFTVGDRGNRDVNPQDITRDNGKVYRIHDDGSVPRSNPFYNQRKAKKAIYSYGHRNPQGLAMDPATGRIWSHEHGPRGGDEVNVIDAGKNYGWPIISYGINYSGTKFAEGTARAGMEQPVIYYVPSIAPCGMTFVTSDRYPEWKGDLIIGSLKFLYLVRADVEGDTIVAQEKVADGIGRVRNVEEGPDGYIYVGIEGQGIYRLIAN